jgi:ribosomal protein L24E
LLEANPDKIDWENLSRNSSAIRLLEANPDKIVWTNLAYNLNPDIVHLYTKLDTIKMKTNMQPFCKELIEYVLHPVRIGRISANVGLELEEYLDIVF